jgi:uncharacterized protein (TIGR02147 family)
VNNLTADYREFLKSELASRFKKNPKYSLRARARQVGVSPATLSLVMKGTRGLSQDSALKVAQRLQLKRREQEYFCLLVQHASCANPELRESIHLRLTSISPKRAPKDIDLDVFKTIADWHHFAILELTQLPTFLLSAQTAARALGIAKIDCELAIDRMKRLGLLKADEQGVLRKSHSKILTKSKSPNQALRSFHKQMLSKAIDSLETQTPDEKIVGSETFAFDPSQISEARELTEEFFQKMVALAAKSKNKSAVYHFGLQLFNLTNERPRP